MPALRGINRCLSSNLRAEAEPLRPILTSPCTETDTFVASAVGVMRFDAPEGGFRAIRQTGDDVEGRCIRDARHTGAGCPWLLGRTSFGQGSSGCWRYRSRCDNRINSLCFAAMEVDVLFGHCQAKLGK